MSPVYDAVVVGAGPNGLAAAIELARHDLSVHVVEGNDAVGGSARTEELTRPGFLHDVGSAVYPLGIGSPFYASLPLADHGLEWINPEIALAHPLEGGQAAFMARDLEATIESLGSDGPAYRNLVGRFVAKWPSFADQLLDSPIRPPRDPLLMARFGARALSSTTRLARRFATTEGRALLAGNAAHSGIPLERRLSGAVGLTLMAAGHAVGWPIPKGGAGALTRALASYFESLGGTIETARRVTSIEDLPPARATLLSLTRHQVADVAKSRLPSGFVDRLRAWDYGPGAFKVDWALDEPIPWVRSKVAEAATVHVGGSFSEIAAAEKEPWLGRVAARPFVLLAQPSLFDDSRAPKGKHTAWAYCHVPNGWEGDATEAIESQVERFAPGFRERILARATHGTADLQRWNPNLVGGDVNGGALTLGQTLGPRQWKARPWSTPAAGLYLCSASFPPGGGVHGMVGYRAARAALRETFGIR